MEITTNRPAFAQYADWPASVSGIADAGGIRSHMGGWAGTEGLRFHELRHEASTWLFGKGLNIMEVASITAHKYLRMLHRYTHLKAEELVVTQSEPKRDFPRSGGRSVKSLCAQFLPDGASRHILAFSPVKPGASLRRLDAWRVSHARGWV